jgi:hypothetical protein
MLGSKLIETSLFVVWTHHGTTEFGPVDVTGRLDVRASGDGPVAITLTKTFFKKFEAVPEIAVTG